MKKRAWRSLLSLVLAFTMVFTIWTPALAKSEAAGEWDPSAEYKLLTVLKDAGIEVYSGDTNPGAKVDLWWNYCLLYTSLWRERPDSLEAGNMGL